MLHLRYVIFFAAIVTLLLCCNLIDAATVGKTETGFDYNPCAGVLCIINTSCIAVEDPFSCQYPPKNPFQSPCGKKPMCVPTGPQYGSLPGYPGRYCGISGEPCPPGFSCEFVQVYCITTPCPPLLMCVDKTPGSIKP